MELPGLSLGSRRNEDIALDLMKFIAMTTNYGKTTGAGVGFGEAITEGFKNLVTFKGRASRSAFWWFFIGAIIIDLIGAIIGRAAHAVAIQYIIYLLVAIGTVSLAVRRLHDSGKSGFWWLIGFIPLIGTITLIVFYCLPGTPGPNKYDA